VQNGKRIEVLYGGKHPTSPKVHYSEGSLVRRVRVKVRVRVGVRVRVRVRVGG